MWPTATTTDGCLPQFAKVLFPKIWHLSYLQNFSLVKGSHDTVGFLLGFLFYYAWNQGWKLTFEKPSKPLNLQTSVQWHFPSGHCILVWTIYTEQLQLDPLHKLCHACHRSVASKSCGMLLSVSSVISHLVVTWSLGMYCCQWRTWHLNHWNSWAAKAYC